MILKICFFVVHLLYSPQKRIFKSERITMAIDRNPSDSEEKRSALCDVTCEVIHKGMMDGGIRFVQGLLGHFKAKLQRQDRSITKAIVSSGDKLGNYDLIVHAGRVRFCVEAIRRVEEGVKTHPDSLLVLVDDMAFVDTELRMMESTYLLNMQ